MKGTKFVALCVLTTALGLSAASPGLEYSAEVDAVASSGDFAPYMIGSWNHGRTTAKNQVTLDLEARRPLDLGSRLSWGAGVEAVTGYSHKALYDRYDSGTGTWSTHRVGPAPVWIQQLYGEVKFRGVFVTAGMKNQTSSLVDDRLSSGDLVQSNNSRPIPMVSAGFVDFQDIPLTGGWLQIEGRVSFGKFMDNSYLRHQYNYFSSHIATGVRYTYKRVYFRTKPSQPLSVTAGVQTSGQYGGKTVFYYLGTNVQTVQNKQGLGTLLKTFNPFADGSDGYVEGSHLGSWDLKARYRFGGGELSGYFQWFWEDGSSMGRRNKWDGLWGLEWKSSRPGILKGAVLEYVDFRDQSGPVHWAPGDRPGTDITQSVTGNDRYYNNSSFNAHANYGMSIGSPFILSPLYNRNGYPQYTQAISRGFHAAAEGSVTPSLDWMAKFSYQVACGSGDYNWVRSLHNTSGALGMTWHADRLLPGLHIGARIAFDTGSLRGDNFGAMLSVRYSGSLSLRKDRPRRAVAPEPRTPSEYDMFRP